MLLGSSVASPVEADRTVEGRSDDECWWHVRDPERESRSRARFRHVIHTRPLNSKPPETPSICELSRDM